MQEGTIAFQRIVPQTTNFDCSPAERYVSKCRIHWQTEKIRNKFGPCIIVSQAGLNNGKY